MAHPADWHRERIKAAIRMTGISLTELSVRNGYEASAVAKALDRPWPAVERIIADHLGTTPQAIWPGRYMPDGTPRIRAHSGLDANRSRDRRHRQIARPTRGAS